MERQKRNMGLTAAPPADFELVRTTDVGGGEAHRRRIPIFCISRGHCESENNVQYFPVVP